MTRKIQAAWKMVLRDRNAIHKLRTSTATTLLVLWFVASGHAQSQFQFDTNGNLLVQKAATSGLPLILGQPQMQVVAPGELASFFVTVADSRGLSYQWRFNGTNLPAPSADVLAFSNINATNQGVYDVVLSNSFGSVTSAPAMLWIDTDDDGLPDSWEISEFGNLSQTATGDFDHDGISNLQEFLDGSNPADGVSGFFRLTVSQDGGTVQVVPLQDNYTNGQTVTLTAIPIAPETFHLWTGDVSAQSNSITLVMNMNKTVFAHFEPFTFTWINAAGGDWNAPANWLPALVPGPDDNVTITSLATVTLNNNATCNNFTFGANGVSPTLTGTATLAAHGNCTWTAGTMEGTGRTVIETGGTLTISNAANVSLNSRTLENGGTLLFTGTTDFYPSAGAVITNRAGALFDVQGPASFIGSPGTVPRIDNAGTFRKSVGSGTTTVGPLYPVLFNNYGSVDIQSGSLTLSGGANFGDIAVPTNTTLNLAGNFTSVLGSTITGAGNLIFTGGFIDLGGLVNVTGPMAITGNSPTVNFSGTVFCTNNTLSIDTGAANFNGSGIVSPAVVNLTGGTLGGSMVVTVTNIMNWTSGTMNGNGRTIISSNALLTINTANAVFLDTRTLENAGTMVWSGAADFYPSAGAVITNRAGALFDVQSSAAFRGSPGATPRIDNAGTFRKSGGTGTTTVGPLYPVLFNNYGSVDIQTGGLAFSGGANFGDIAVPTNTTLNLAGNFTAVVGSTITGAGNLIFTGGFIDLGGLVNVTGPMVFTGNSPTVNFSGTVFCTNNTLSIDAGAANFNGSGIVSPAVISLTGGALGGNMVVTVGNTMNWTSGTINGNGRTIISSNALLTINTASPVFLDTRTLENAGTMVWFGAADFYPSSGAVITNRPGALFDVQSSAAFRGSPGAAPRIDNAGTFRKSVSTGTTVIGPFYPVQFNNYGTVDIQSGILLANGGYACTSNSTLNCALWGTAAGATYGQLQVSGSVNLNGTLSVNVTNNYTPTTNDVFAPLVATACTGSFARFLYPSNQVTMVLSNTVTAELVYVLSVSPQPPVPLPTPAGIISWWRAENDALDAIGANHGVLTNGVAFASGKVGQSFLFDGTTNYVLIPDSPSLRPASVTVEAWVKIFSTNGTQLVFAKPIGSGTLDSYGLALVNGAPLAAICDANGFGTFISTTTPLALGQWYHLAFSFDGNTRQEALYVNGIAVAAANAAKSMAFDSHPLLLGADIENGVPGLFLNGQIDEASIYNRALAANEIAAIYNVASAGKQLSSVIQPVLQIETIAPATARIYWSTNFPAFHLEYSTGLGTTNWAASALTPVITGTNFVITNSFFGIEKFYRLSRLPSVYFAPPPALLIEGASTSAVRLVWPAEDDRTFKLQSNSNLMDSWVTVLPQPTILGGNNVVTNAINGRQRFYRLAFP
ncbi:MAG TPA: LamG-like jellyroll fold domain-containing protein [Verrucomicrobiae bacterium]|jgi:hypothetical protein|nr:LamG-like jellyroll fold domain-containing protein [Verrucomicrobiae bacterium]